MKVKTVKYILPKYLVFAGTAIIIFLICKNVLPTNTQNVRHTRNTYLVIHTHLGLATTNFLTKP